MTNKKIIWVKCSYILPVEVPDNDSYDEYFDIEENHCPATGIVGLVFDELYKFSNENSTCWACTVGGRNKIVDKPKNGDDIVEYLKKLINKE